MDSAWLHYKGGYMGYPYPNFCLCAFLGHFKGCFNDTRVMYGFEVLGCRVQGFGLGLAWFLPGPIPYANMKDAVRRS